MPRHTGGGGRLDRGPRQVDPAPAEPPLFDVARDHAELVDELAERQAEIIGLISSSQLRRFFGEAKDLYRRLHTGGKEDGEREKLYKESIEPQFRMMRSKVSYAFRAGQRGQSKIPKAFHDFIANGVRKVRSADDFDRFIQHFEAVVGFCYGKGLASKS